MKLTQKGEAITLKPKDSSNRLFHAKLIWETSIDLDLYCMYRLKSIPKQPTSFFGKIVGSLTEANSQEGKIFYGFKGRKDKAPWITLDKDSGVGDTGGYNEENIHFHDINQIESAIIVANIFAKTTNFSQYNASVIVEGGSEKFEIPLTETKTGSWCVVAKIETINGNAVLKNINQTITSKPMLRNY